MHTNDIVIVHSTSIWRTNPGVRVVAEGVETEATLKQLCLPGCDQAQGYLKQAHSGGGFF